MIVAETDRRALRVIAGLFARSSPLPRAGSPQELPPGAPTDPYVPDSGIRLVKSWLRCRDGTLSEPPPQAGAGNAPATVGSDPRKCSNPACDVAAISSRDGPPCIGSGPTLRRCP